MISKVEGLLNSSARKVAALFAVPAVLALATVAHADPEIRSAPLGVSFGIGGGFAPAHRTCAGANKEGCDRLSFGHKVYAGYDVTNDVTAQVSYLYFNGVNRDWDNARNPVNARERVASRAWGVGIDWHIELLHSVTNHLRAGWGRMQTRQTNFLRTGGTEEINRIEEAPYVGAGLALAVNEYFSVDASFDYYFASSRSRHLLYIGANTQF
jgi:opacity protein-like surface antigen